MTAESVFVCGTYKDLQNFRAGVRNAILAMGAHPLMMEDFPADSRDSATFCMDQASKADIYVLILAFRYGDIVSGYDFSMTELEYRQVRDNPKDVPVLCFFIDESTSGDWPPEYVDTDVSRANLERFKREIGKKHTFKDFTTEEDLALKVMAALHPYLSRPFQVSSISGYVYGDRHWNIKEVDFALSETKPISVPAPENADAPLGVQLLERLIESYHIISRMINAQAIREDENPIELPCGNQHDAMYEIRFGSLNTRIPTRVFELSGLRGMGKTHVLQYMCQELDRKTWKAIPDAQWGTWRYAHVCADKESWGQGFDSIIEQLRLKIRPDFTPHDMQGSIDGLAQCIQSVIVEHDPSLNRILFIIDDADAIPEDALTRLIGDDGPAGSVLKKMLPPLNDIQLQLVIATRRPRLTQRLLKANNIFGVKQLPLTPLSLLIIEGILSEVSEGHVSPGDFIRDRSTEIFEITGGYPAAVSSILSRYQQRYWAGAIEEKAYLPLVLNVVQQKIIHNLSVKEYLLLNVLSVFRHFDENKVYESMERGLLNQNFLDNLRIGIFAIKDWLIEQCEAPALIRKNRTVEGILKPFAIDPALRHILLKHLEQMTPTLLQALHKTVWEMYDNSQRRLDRSGMRLVLETDPRIVAIIEALYHRAQLCRLAPEPSHVLSDLAADYTQLLERACRESETSRPHVLHDTWDADEELKDLIKTLPDGDKAFDRIDTVFKRLDEPPV